LSKDSSLKTLRTKWIPSDSLLSHAFKSWKPSKQHSDSECIRINGDWFATKLDSLPFLLVPISFSFSPYLILSGPEGAQDVEIEDIYLHRVSLTFSIINLYTCKPIYLATTFSEPFQPSFLVNNKEFLFELFRNCYQNAIKELKLNAKTK
jgi:hypothetical protein